MKKILILLFFPLISLAQNPGYILLKKINGIEVYYKLTKVNSDKKKDNWIIDIEYLNTTEKDFYYISETTPAKGKGIFAEEARTTAYFGTINIANTKGIWSSSGSSLEGDKTRLKTDSGESIYSLNKGKLHTRTIEFSTEKEAVPIVTYQIRESISFTDNLYSFL